MRSGEAGRRPEGRLETRYALLLAALVCCRTPPKPAPADAEAKTDASSSVQERVGMAYVPAGTLVVGTPADRSPRVADEEPAGTETKLDAFYIDLYPFPNEPGAIPSVNVTRDEAEQLCATKNKRLCSELEWERACKGPANTPYEYGDAYKEAACGTGVKIEEAARRPSGDHATCKSRFGVVDLHGGAWEWTSSSWKRGHADGRLGVLRGGNGVPGELVGRCANAIGRPATKKTPTFGFRCCSGEKNATEVELDLKGTPGLDPTKVASPVPGAIERAWRWVPVQNEELTILIQCRPGSLCAIHVARGSTEIANIEVGPQFPELARIGDARHLRYRGTDAKGTFNRELTYIYGRVEPGEIKRP